MAFGVTGFEGSAGRDFVVSAIADSTIAVWASNAAVTAPPVFQKLSASLAARGNLLSIAHPPPWLILMNPSYSRAL
jgi:hypothetical protein